MLRCSLLLCAMFLLPLAPAAAQTSAPPIEQQMTPEEFKAAGLNKLSADELAGLNTWLKRTVASESGKAVAQARHAQQTSSEGRTSESNLPFEATLVGRFDGFRRGLKFTLDNGQVWQQIDTATMDGVKLENPRVKLKPGVFGSVWFMRVDGRAVNAKVKRIK